MGDYSDFFATKLLKMRLYIVQITIASYFRTRSPIFKSVRRTALPRAGKSRSEAKQ